jgi:hypothetical protein
MMTISRLFPAAIALLLAACADDAEPANGPRDPDSARASQSAAAPQAGDSVAAPAVAATPAVPAEPQDTMLTRWTTLQMPSEPWVQEADSPEALLRQVRDVVAAQMEEPDASVLPTRMLSEAADSAVGHLVHPNLADDSIRDVEFRLHMRREGTVWRVTGVDRRERCRRGVAEGGRCA